MDKLCADRIVPPETRVCLADSILGVGVREGTRKSDVLTIEAFKRCTPRPMRGPPHLGRYRGLTRADSDRRCSATERLSIEWLPCTERSWLYRVAAGRCAVRAVATDCAAPDSAESRFITHAATRQELWYCH